LDKEEEMSCSAGGIGVAQALLRAAANCATLAAAIVVSVAVCESTFPGLLHTQEFLFCHFLALLEQTAWHALMTWWQACQCILASPQAWMATGQ
jgi:hypothetical protein